ncbi:hypothetical protein [Okeania sp. SIO2G4]|nr:hypothetical protein [Okeania sp. SIO2G4]
MTRRQNTLKASESECQQIKQRIQAKAWPKILFAQHSAGKEP